MGGQSEGGAPDSLSDPLTLSQGIFHPQVVPHFNPLTFHSKPRSKHPVIIVVTQYGGYKSGSYHVLVVITMQVRYEERSSVNKQPRLNKYLP